MERTGLRVQFLRGDGDSPTEGYNEIAYVASITPPALQRDTVEVDSLNPQDDIKKKLLGLLDPGELSITLNFVPGDEGAQNLQADVADGLPCNYRIQWPLEGEQTTPAYLTIPGIATGFAIQEISAGSVIQAEVTITVVLKPEWTDATEGV